MEIIIQFLDYILIGIAIWGIFAVRNLGGDIGRAFTFMMVGMIFLGIAHMFETFSFEILKWGVDQVELVHRLIVLTGFICLILGVMQATGRKAIKA